MMDAEEAQKYSWHSFRIFVACSLRAMKCPDWQIQRMLRWSTPEMVNVYGRQDQDEQLRKLDEMLITAPVFDVREAANLPTTDDYNIALSLEEMLQGINRISL
jgi:hypothetical protein